MIVRHRGIFAGAVVAAILLGVVGGVVVARSLADDDDEGDTLILSRDDTDDTDGSGGSAGSLPPAGLETNDDVRGAVLPEATLSDADGEPVEVSSFVGDPLVVNFWFSTCAPCAKELPDFAEVHAERGDEVRFIGVNPIDRVEAMEEFAGERGVTYELYRDDLSEFTDGIGASSFPITIFVSSDGEIVSQTGPIDAAELRAEIDALVAEEARA